jgi:hypothetical protein
LPEIVLPFETPQIISGDGAKAAQEEAKMTRRYHALSAGAGFLFVACSLAASFAFGDSPAYDEGGAVIAAWYAEHSTRFLIGHVLAGLVFLVFYIPFLGGLIERLREAEGPPHMWSNVAFAGAILCPATGTARGLFATSPALLEGDVSPEVASFAAAAAAYGLIVSGAMSGVFTGAAAIIMLDRGARWTWLGWLGAVAAVTAITSLVAVLERDPEGPLALLSSTAWIVFFAWIVAASCALVWMRDWHRT